MESDRMRLAECKSSPKKSEEKDSIKNGWENLPYPAIHSIVKLDL